MNKRLIVDFKIAASERATLFTNEFQWPVAQSTYDDPLRDFVEWSQLLPGELSDRPQLRIAYELIESDLLVDIASIVGAWIDVSAARQNDLELVYGSNQRLYEMLSSDRFEGFSPIADARVAGEQALRNPSRRASRFVKQTIKKFGRRIKGVSNVHSISANPLLYELTGGPNNLFRFAYADVAAQRPTSHSTPAAITELATEIQSQLSVRLANAGHQPTPEFDAYVKTLAANNLTNGSHDQNFNPGFTPSSGMTLFTGTGGNYLARTVSHAFLKNDAQVVRTTHGGDTSLFDDPLWPSIELPFSSTYTAFGTQSAAVVKPISAQLTVNRNSTETREIIAGGSQFHQQIVDQSSPSQNVKNIYVISASFSGTRRALPNVKLHDTVYLEWHRRLLGRIQHAGYEVFAKRHPKGNGADVPIFDDVATHELRQSGMADTFKNADAYVFDIAGSAYIEALCTLKPVVLIDIPNRRLNDEARKQLSKSSVIVRATFNENNLVEATLDEVTEGLQQPVDIDARRKFIHDYLTSYDAQRDDLKTIARK